MKIAFLGNPDFLASGILERLKKEEHEIYFLTDSSEEKLKKPFSDYHHYMISHDAEDFHRVFASVSPDALIFEGMGYLKACWNGGEQENLSLLAFVLEECASRPDCRFMLLSSTEVYGNPTGTVDEDSTVTPDTVKGRWLLEEERMVQLYADRQRLQATVLRLGEVYSDEIRIGGASIFDSMLDRILRGETFTGQDRFLRPIHVSDVADAVVRVLGTGTQSVYNVCAAAPMALSQTLHLIAQNAGEEEHISLEGSDAEPADISSKRIRTELEWTDLRSLEQSLAQKQIPIVSKETHKAQKAIKQKRGQNLLRRTMENVVLFALFAILFYLTKDHTLFASVNWLLIYVTVISVIYGVRQGALAVVLSSVYYTLASGQDILQMTNFYSYAGTVLRIVEFVFFGVAVGYTADTLRQDKAVAEANLKQVSDSYERLKEINDKNVLLKDEYERRVLDAKTSLPRLYSIINKITVLETNRIFMEVLNVIRDLIGTDTVAVYKVTSGSNYLRLIDSLNKESNMEGNSWNLTELPQIREALDENRIYEGDIWKQEPAIVLPICSSEGCEAAVVIKELPMESHSLYTVNLLRTLLVLISDSIQKALQYDSATHDVRYIEGTGILVAEEFTREVELAMEKKERSMADCCMLRIESQGNPAEVYHKAEKMFRAMDIWGVDEKGGLFVLLGNGSEKDAEIVLERLAGKGIKAEMVRDRG